MPDTEKPDKMPETPAPESGQAEHAGATATGTTVPRTLGTEPPDRQEHLSGVIFGMIFWLAILGGVAYWLFAPHNRAQVFLQTSAQPPRQLTGIVLFKGTPVTKGTVYLFFEDPRKDLYLASAILPVTEGGKFVTVANESSVL